MSVAQQAKLNSEKGENTRPNLFEMKINKMDVPLMVIQQLVVREYAYSLLPIMELTISDEFLWSEYNPIQEGHEINITMGSTKDSDPTIKTVFEIISFEHKQVQTGLNGSSTITIILGTFKANQIIGDIDSKAYKNMTATKVIESLATELKVPVDIKIQSQDKMTWWRLNQSYLDFFNLLVNKSFPGDNDTPFIYFDTMGKLNFTSLKTALNSNIKVLAHQNPTLANRPDENETYVNFTSYYVKDQSGFTNKFGGNKTTFSYYDTENIITKEFNSDNIDTNLVKITNKTELSKGKTSKHIIYGLLNPSVYPNYFDAQAGNQYIKQTFLTTSTVITIPAHSNIKLFDKIYVVIKTASAKQGINEVYSGNYIITGIVHVINNKESYSMTLVLSRDGQNKSNLWDQYKSKLIEV